MALAQLGESIRRPLQRLSNATTIDEPLLHDCVAEFALALLKADVQFKLVHDMHANIMKIIKIDDLVASKDKRKIIQEAVFNELCTILDSGKPSFTPEKGKTSVVMFVGLQGSGKTTACTKYAYYHLKKGYKPALVCADTFTADAFDQLKQNATIAKIPLHRSYTESDPVRIAVEGVERFKKENWDLIIVDTSGHHKQEALLFEETRQVYEKTKPDLVIFVIDSSTGKAAYDQVQAFKQSVPVGAVIVTKMDGHVKGGGTLTTVATTQSPVIFIGTGEHMNEFEVFDVKSFVSRLLGIGDWFVREVVTMDQRSDLLRTMTEGNFTLRDMYKMIQCVLQDGPRQTLSKLQGKIQEKWMPKDNAEEIEAKLEKRSAIFESMTDKELDSSILERISECRIRQIAAGCGYPITDVMEMLEGYKKVAKRLGRMKEARSLRMEVGYAKLLRPYRA